MLSSQRGWVAVWFLGVVALIVAVIGFAAAAGGKTDGWEIAVAGAAACIVAAGLAIELRRDPWDVAAFGLAVGLIGAIICGLIATVMPRPTPLERWARRAGVHFGSAVGGWPWRLSCRPVARR